MINFKRLCLVLLLLAGCAPTRLQREDMPSRCETPDAAALLQAAQRSLVLHPYRPRVIYDLDDAGRAVPFHAGRLAPDALAVLSYPDPQRFAGGAADFARMAHRSFLYDNALAVLWLVHVGDLPRARRVLATVAALQRPDGAWGFGFNAGDEDGYYNAAYVRTGAVAWVVYALAHYQQASHDVQFADTLARATQWLLAQRDAQTGLFRAGSGRWLDAAHFQPSWPARFFSTEHQIDVWFALAALARLSPQGTDVARYAQGLRAGIYQRLWLPEERRFAQGMAVDGQPDKLSALDASGTWAALWLLAQGDRVRAEQVLSWVTQQHAIVASGWNGLRPYRDGAPTTWFVEGSIAEPLALSRLGHAEAAQRPWQMLGQLACTGGLPLVYAPDWHTDFPLTPAAAPTLWFLIAGQEIVEGSAPWLWTER